jgi:hypothetical protein
LRGPFEGDPKALLDLDDLGLESHLAQLSRGDLGRDPAQALDVARLAVHRELHREERAFGSARDVDPLLELEGHSRLQHALVVLAERLRHVGRVGVGVPAPNRRARPRVLVQQAVPAQHVLHEDGDRGMLQDRAEALHRRTVR